MAHRHNLPSSHAGIDDRLRRTHQPHAGLAAQAPTRRALWCLASILAVALAIAAPVAADNTLYFGAGLLSVDPPGQPAALELTTRPVVGGVDGTVLSWEYKLRAPAQFVPRATHFVLNVTEPTPVPASTQASVAGLVGINACAFHLYVGTDEAGFVYCNSQHQGSVLQPGLHPLDFDWRTDLEPVAASAGATVHVTLTTGALSASLHPTMFVEVGRPDDLSSLLLVGTAEPGPVRAPPSEAPANGTTPATGQQPPVPTTPSSGPPSGTSTTSSAPAPEPGSAARDPEDAGAADLGEEAPPMRGVGMQPAKATPVPALLALGALGLALLRRRAARLP